MDFDTRDRLIIVDEHDNEISTGDKLYIHRQGLLHRAFSIFIFNSSGEYLLQKRAVSKYHSGGLWSNTCCSHPRKGEKLEDAAHKRLQEEMGFDCGLTEFYSFIYRAEFPNGLIEYEFDHVFTGIYEGTISPHPEEVCGWEWVPRDRIRERIAHTPEIFTRWFIIAFNHIDACPEAGNLQLQKPS